MADRGGQSAHEGNLRLDRQRGEVKQFFPQLPTHAQKDAARAASVVLAGTTAVVMLAVERLRVPSLGAF